jgi:hypothetical protein
MERRQSLRFRFRKQNQDVLIDGGYMQGGREEWQTIENDIWLLLAWATGGHWCPLLDTQTLVVGQLLFSRCILCELGSQLHSRTPKLCLAQRRRSWWENLINVRLRFPGIKVCVVDICCGQRIGRVQFSPGAKAFFSLGLLFPSTQLLLDYLGTVC